MPPTLDLSRTSHSKMIISPPRINLRKAASYNHDRGPLSSTSSRFSFNHLVFASPPPSPGLPSLSPPPRRPSRGLAGLVRPSRIIRYTLWALSVLFVFYIAKAGLTCLWSVPALGRLSRGERETVAHANLPDYPTPVVVTDRRGKAKWTVSIPKSYDFPLTIAQYSDICVKCREVSERLQVGRSQQSYLAFGSEASARGFVDVHEAQKAGYLPVSAIAEKGEGGSAKKPVCVRSLTVVLESDDAGLGSTLMLLWTAYGVAQKEGRAFFIDDTRWAYGKYTDIFQPPPAPGCSAPPKQEMIPCPREARHLVVLAVTADQLTGGLTGDKDDSSDQADFSSREPEFRYARLGHDALFRLNKEDDDYVEARVRTLMARRIVPRTKGTQNGLVVGAHVRRGDRHPLEFQYRDSFLPLNIYAEAARSAIEEKFNRTGTFGIEDKAAKEHSFLVVASDDPMVYEGVEFAGSMRAQERIRLASKQAIQKAEADRHVMRKYVDESFGWEGGFYAPMFWNLGQASASASSVTKTPSSETLRLRSLVGRAYMMDLAVLADASDTIICTASAAGCRLLAVMMGWDSAMTRGNWINIDGGARW